MIRPLAGLAHPLFEAGAELFDPLFAELLDELDEEELLDELLEEELLDDVDACERRSASALD